MKKISKSKGIISRTKVKYNIETEYPLAGLNKNYVQDFKFKGHSFKGKGLKNSK